jgi:hypothetical protein
MGSSSPDSKGVGTLVNIVISDDDGGYSRACNGWVEPNLEGGLKSLAAGPVMATADAPLYDGSWSAWLGGYNNANDKLFQGFTVPAGCKSLKIVEYVDVY